MTLVSSGDELRAEAFAASLRELLQRLELSLDVRTTADAGVPEGEALAAVDADFTDPDAVKLTVIDALGRTVLVRRLGRATTRQLQVEAAAHVVHSVVEELAAVSKGKPALVQTPPPAEPVLESAAPPVVEQRAPSPPASPSRFALDLGAFFGGRTFLNRAPITPGGGVAISLAARLGNYRPSVTWLADYHAPFETGPQDRLVTLKIETLSLRTLVTLDVFGGGDSGFRVDLGLGGGVDLFFSAPRSDDVPSSQLRARRDADPVVTALIAGRLAISSSVDVYLAFTLDLDLWPIRYVASYLRMPPETLYAPFPVRPMLALGFTFNALGAEPYR